MTDIDSAVSYDKIVKMSENVSQPLENSIQSTIENEKFTVSKNEILCSSTTDNVDNNKHVAELNIELENISSDIHTDYSEGNNQDDKTNSLIIKENNTDQLNDSENVEKVIIKTNKKRITLIDSDSEEEKIDDNDNVSSKGSNKQTLKKHLTLIDSDSEEEQIIVKNNQQIDNESILKKKNSRLLKLCDSDSEDDMKIENKIVTMSSQIEEDVDKEQTNQKKKSRLLQLCDSDSEGDTNNKIVTMTFQTENDYEKEQTLSRLKTLCDSESSSEETEENDISKDNIIKENHTKKYNEPVDKPMTGKEALEQRRQITSESQKMVRETRIHLPYHRPKQHTLQEFLKRKNILNTSIKAPPNTPTGLSIKILNKSYKTAEKKLKEREKEIEQFYKSESEDESTNVEDQIKENNAKKPAVIPENCINEVEKSITNLEVQNDKEKDAPIQENISFDKINLTMEKEKSENNIEALEIEKHEQLFNADKNNDTLIENISESIEEEQKREKLTDTNEHVDKNKEEKLKELREILEKNLHSFPNKDDTVVKDDAMETEDNESENYKQLSQEQTQQFDDKEEKKKKLLEIQNKLKQLKPLIPLRSNFQPRLSGGPNELIVLDDDIEKSKRVNNLMQRFLKHTAKKQTSKTTEVNIINVDGGVIHNDTITVVEEPDDEPAKKNQIPGVRMKKLKMELEDQILKQRMEELKKRQEEMKLDEEDDTYVGEKETCGLSNKLLDNEEEEELTDPSSESESEEEEDDIELIDKPRVKSAFVDEEAEESDEECDEIMDEEDNNDDDDDEDDDNDELETEITESKEETGPKQLRRIIKPVEDSDDETSSPPEDEKKSTVAISNELLSQTPHKSNTWEDNDEDIPVYQQQSEHTPCKLATQSKNDLTTFLTPTFHLTALQGMNSATKGSPNVNSYLPPEPSPLKSNSSFKTKLFADHNEDNLDDLENLCSGKFITQIDTQKDLSTQENELLNICSGNFTTLTQDLPATIDSFSNNLKTTQSFEPVINENSENFGLTIENEETIEQLVAESMENENDTEQIICSTKTPKMIIASSSEDEDKENKAPKKKKLKKKRKYIIDDISVSDDEDLEDREDDFEEEEPRNINYDSEENEIEYEEFDNEISVKPAKEAIDFLEKEAELSESEWGSEDEDEKNLDNYEIEEGDTEKINEKKIQRELERMHMRNVLDEDQREVKMLQEILLDDGELHGTGRERKFRWKNADSLSWNEEKPKEEDEECEEVESELHWRKMRHEREMFLKEQEAKKQSLPDDEIMNDSQFLKLGQKALKKSIFGSQHLSQKKTPIAESITKTDDIKLPFALAVKRGSFLQRSETTLARIAEITKVGSTLGGPKNSKNFIFTTVEKTEIIEEVNIKKRKAEEGTPKALKKIRIADMSPSVQTKKKK